MRRIVLLVLAAVGLLVGVPHRSTTQGVVAGTAVRLDVEQLVDRADLVFEGRVLSMRAIEPSPGRIETEYTIEVDRSFWGEAEQARSFRLPGGVLPGGRGLMLPGMPSLKPGEDALLFLTEEGGSGVRMPVGLAQGKLTVVTSLSGRRVLSRRQFGLSTIDPGSGAVQHAGEGDLLDYAETVAVIRAAADRRAATGSALGGER